jgi:hypothetical protein
MAATAENRESDSRREVGRVGHRATALLVWSLAGLSLANLA